MLKEEEFSIRIEAGEGCVVVAVSGELDELNAVPVDQTLTECANGLPVIVDLSEVTFICSTSLRVLFKQRAGGRPSLVAPNRNVAKVLDIVQASRTNPVFRIEFPPSKACAPPASERQAEARDDRQPTSRLRLHELCIQVAQLESALSL
jgi:anti-anti-sigma factor